MHKNAKRSVIVVSLTVYVVVAGGKIIKDPGDTSWESLPSVTPVSVTATSSASGVVVGYVPPIADTLLDKAIPRPTPEKPRAAAKST